MTEDKRKELEDKISSSSGYPLFKFLGQIRKDIGGFDKKEKSHMLRFALARLHQLWVERFGDWYQAIHIVDTMPEVSFARTESLPNVLGYPCQLVVGKRKAIMISNGETNSAYVRDLGESEISMETAKKIFES